MISASQLLPCSHSLWNIYHTFLFLPLWLCILLNCFDLIKLIYRQEDEARNVEQVASDAEKTSLEAYELFRKAREDQNNITKILKVWMLLNNVTSLLKWIDSAFHSFIC